MRRWFAASAGQLAIAAPAASLLKRFFVDAPSDVGSMDVPVEARSLVNSDIAASDTYSHPLDVVDSDVKLYGVRSDFTNDDGNRIFASGKLHSYDPAILYADLLLQETQGEVAPEADQAVASTAASVAKGDDMENDAVMREGRDKQGAAGAAVVAAAMLDARRGAEGVPMVPGHPLPVVFPRPDGLPPPLRFIKKFGPGMSRMTTSKGRVRLNLEQPEDMDKEMYGEVMESDAAVEGHSIQRSIAFQVRVLDEHKRAAKVRQFQHFSEISDAMPQRVMEGLANCGFLCPTLLQSAAIPQLLQGKDVIGIAPSGSGNTVAFAVASLAVLLKVLSNGDPRANMEAGKARPLLLILCPTRESVQRTSATYSSMAGEDVRVTGVYLSKEEDKQATTLQEGCDVLVATATRLSILLEAGTVDLSQVHFVAVSELDKIIERGVVPQLKTVLDTVRKNTVQYQLSLWSSFISEEVEEIATQYLSPLAVTVMVSREEQTNMNVRQILYPLKSRDDRLPYIKRLYETRVILKRNQVLVYVAYKERAEALAKELTAALSAPSSMVKFVHSGLRSKKRNQVINEFKHGDVRILVGTDLGTKNFEVMDIEHVINYDLPASTDLYARRVSHVGRAGRGGTVHTFFTPNDSRAPLIAKFVEEQTGRKLGPEITALVESIEVAGGEDDWSTPLIRFSDHAAAHSKWRVRGKRDGRHNLTKLLQNRSESDEKPAGRK